MSISGISNSFRLLWASIKKRGSSFPDGAGISDPCEKEATDAIGHLDNQQREQITASAQVRWGVFTVAHFTSEQFDWVQLCLYWLCYSEILGRINPKKRNNVTLDYFGHPYAVSSIF